MFTFIVQVADLFTLGTIGVFLVFYIFSWFCLFVRLYFSSKYKQFENSVPQALPSVSIIIPVVDEKPHVFELVLSSIRKAAEGLDAEFFVVGNGAYSKDNISMAESMGFKTLTLKVANKRKAIVKAVQISTKDIAVILDSDTVASDDCLKVILQNFQDPAVGGVVPNQVIFNRDYSVMRRLSDWFEDVRFNNTLKGLSARNSVHCLPGRLFAIRMDRLKHYSNDFVSQKMFGVELITGDDRVLTSYLLKDGFKTIYDNRTTVLTDAPNTLKQFAKQRLRWSRSSFRETLLSLGWIWNRPYMAFVLLTDIIVRWAFFFVIVIFLYRLATDQLFEHYWHFSYLELFSWSILGFFVSGFLKQIPHIWRYPQDLFYAPVFSLLSTFILTPIEWYGNITFLKQGWLTRKTKTTV